jgi:citrate lyase subunit beta/citryl-CoA lyase
MTMRAAQDLDLLRAAATFLFVPGVHADRFDKAAAAGAGAVIVDLEDAVLPDMKDSARAQLVAWLERGGRAVVRVNAPGTPWFDDDVACLQKAMAVMVPKVESGSDVRRVVEATDGRLPVLPLIETPRGVAALQEICEAPLVARLSFGNVDFGAEVGVDPASHAALAAARSQIVYASSAAGIAAPVDGVTTAVRDHEALVRDAQHGRELGFTGKLVIHPTQIAPVERVLRPTEDELRWARSVLASAQGGVGVHEGNMVDVPVLRRAHQLLDRAGDR